MDPGGLQHPVRDVRRCGPEDQCWEESRNGLPPVPGNGNTVRDCVRETGDGSRAFLPGEAAGSG